MIKIEKLKAKGFGNFQNLEIVFQERVTKLVGMNGAGKSSVLLMIWACLKGLAKKNTEGQLIADRYQFIAQSGAADIELTLIDQARDLKVVVKNHITEKSNGISFQEIPRKGVITGSWLKNLLNVAFMSAKNFTALQPKEQAILLGIDTKVFDEQIADLKESYTAINRQKRAMGEPEFVEEVEPVSVLDLVAKKDEIERFNAAQQELLEMRKTAHHTVDGLIDEITKLQAEIEEKKNQLAGAKDYLESLATPKEAKSTAEISSQILKVDSINSQHHKWQQYEEKIAAIKKLEGELEENKNQQAEVTEKKLQHIKSFEFGMDGMGVDEDGGLTLNGRHIKEPYFSKGELEVIVAKLAVNLDQELRFRFIDDADLLDDTNLEALVKFFKENDIQAVFAHVGDEAKGKGEILLRECKAQNGEQ